MQEQVNVEVAENKFISIVKKIFSAIWKGLKNETFLYILKRVLSSCLTAILIVAVVTALIRLLPDTSLYDLKIYNKLLAQGKKVGLGDTVAEAYKNKQLFQYGRCTIDGRPVSVIENIFTYIYWILPIYKEIPYAWDSKYEVVKKQFEGYVYFGRSIDQKVFVVDMLTSKMGISFKVTLITVFFTYLIGYPLGIAMAKKPGGIIDKIGNVFIVLNYAIPALVFYLFMQKIMGNPEGVFGSFDFNYFYDPEKPGSLFPPIFCMVFLSIPGVIIWLRRFMIDELSSDYVKFARSKGLSENRIMYTHVLRNAIVPLIRNIPATFIGAIVGSYFVEAIWKIDGTGNLLINGLQKMDVPVVQGLTVIYSLLGMISFLLGDIITVFFDPRIKLRAE